jgi:hypothetical protein
MKTLTKLTLVAATVAAFHLLTPTAEAARPYVTRGEQVFRDFEKRGTAGGDKIDRSLKAISPRQKEFNDSLKKQGPAPGDRIDRSLQAVPGKAKWL